MDVVPIVARQGRELQRYNEDGGRLVVGCIPYRFKNDKPCCSNVEQSIEVLVISSQKGNGIMFPKGGWEMDETITEAATREALEEAGVDGQIEDVLGKWLYKSRSNGSVYEGYMFPLRVMGELLHWPEMNARKRRWVSVAEVMDGCEHWWMKEALDELVRNLASSSKKETVSHTVSFSCTATENSLICSSKQETISHSQSMSFSYATTENALLCSIKKETISRSMSFSAAEKSFICSRRQETFSHSMSFSSEPTENALVCSIKQDTVSISFSSTTTENALICSCA